MTPKTTKEILQKLQEKLTSYIETVNMLNRVIEARKMCCQNEIDEAASKIKAKYQLEIDGLLKDIKDYETIIRLCKKGLSYEKSV